MGRVCAGRRARPCRASSTGRSGVQPGAAVDSGRPMPGRAAAIGAAVDPRTGGARDPSGRILAFPGVKRIDAIIKPYKLDDVKERLAAIGVQGITVNDVRGFGRQKGHTELFRGAEYVVDFLPKVQLSILVPDDRVSDTVDAIVAGARTGRIGDGKIVITDVDEVVRIRTGERGPAAV